MPPFIDGSCRREPDFQAAMPSVTALCRSTKFAPRLSPGDRVAYITGQGRYDGDVGWCLVALLTVVSRFETHDQAALWYQTKGYNLPSNCMSTDNPPQAFDLTNQQPPSVVAARLKAEHDPVRAVRLWDAIYARRAKECGVFLVCHADFLELHHPPVIRRADLIQIFGRIPGTQTPPAISDREIEALASLAVTH